MYNGNCFRYSCKSAANAKYDGEKVFRTRLAIDLAGNYSQYSCQLTADNAKYDGEKVFWTRLATRPNWQIFQI